MNASPELSGAQPLEKAPSHDHPALVLIVVAGVSLMVVLDATIVTIALPSMGHYFHRGPTEMTWAVNAFTLAFGGLLLLGGRAGDILGRRRPMMVGLALFALGSVGAGLAATYELLLAARVIQGVGAAIASPVALSLITTTFAEGTARNRAIGVYSVVSGAGAAVGLLLGGLLTEYLSWRWVFFVNGPIGVILIVATFYYVHEDVRRPARFDVLGSLLSVAGMVGLVYALIHAASDGWHDGETITVLSVAVVLLALFGAYESRRHCDAIVPGRILRDRNRASAYLVILVVGASFFGVFYFTTFYLQGVLEYTPLKAGVAFLPALVILAASTQVSATLLPRVGPKPLVLFGTVVLAGALLWLSTISGDASYLGSLLPALLVVAIGLGAVLVPLTAIVMSQVNQADAGTAAALLNVGQQLGGSLGLAILASSAATAATDAGKAQTRELLTRYGLGPHILNFASLAQSLQAGTTPSSAAARDLVARNALNTVQAHSYGMGYQTAAIFAAAAIVVVAVGIRGKSAAASSADV